MLATLVAGLKSIRLWGEAPPNARDLVILEEWISREMSGLFGAMLLMF
jgi:hypothetical protein